MRIANVTLVVPDYDEAIEFYSGRLGFQLLEDTDLGAGKRWVRVAPQKGETALLIAKADGCAQQEVIGHQTGGRVSFFLETDDFARDYQAFFSAGVVFTEEPRREPYGQ
ncbi:MAG: VOC family protein, partial [Pseudomonadota bacterium]